MSIAKKLELMTPEINEELHIQSGVKFTGNLLGFLIAFIGICTKYFIKDGKFKLPSIFKYPSMIIAFFKLFKESFTVSKVMGR